MTDLLSLLRASDVLSALDTELARTLSDLADDSTPEVQLGIAVASRATREGHVCADLTALSDQQAFGGDGAPLGVQYPSLERWRPLLLASPLVGDGSTETPLVLDTRHRLYLRRHWHDEQQLGRALSKLSRASAPTEGLAAHRDTLRALFPSKGGEPDHQRIAAEIACVSRFCTITGGPGTGKTTTVARVLALLAAAAITGGRTFRPLLLAPTGKAAARLSESVATTTETLDCSAAVRALIPREARTIHRALEAGRSGFRINADRPLLAQCIVVDEASMVDLSLMRSLVEAIPRDGRLILLGDRHQLSSVEAGAVLADITGDAEEPRYSPALAERLSVAFDERLPSSWIRADARPLDDAVAHLVRSHRFSETGTLAELARAIRTGDTDSALACLTRDSDEIRLLEPPERGLAPALAPLVREGYRALTDAADGATALGALSSFRVLCAHRRGPLGLQFLNEWISGLLSTGRTQGGRPGFMSPILVLQNDAPLGVFNGDVGVLWRESAGDVRALLPARNQPRVVSPARLPPFEPAFAMSVHKSQGSEFDTVVVVLPPAGSPLLTRELLYTAVTRARRRVILHGSRAVVVEAIQRRVTRATGLSDVLRA